MNKRRAASIAILVLSVVLLAIAIAWQPSGPGAELPGTGIDVVLVGIDGLDWFLVTRYVEEGRMPTLERLLRSAVRAEVTPTRPPVPDAGWTVLGRGRGLSSEERSRLEEGGDRRLFGITPDVARVAHRGGRSAVSIGWPTSWPAAAAGPLVAAPYVPNAPSHDLSIAPSFFAGAPGQASSPALAEMIDTIVARNEAESARAFTQEIYGGPAPTDPVWERHLTAARWGYLADRIVLDVAGGLIAEEEPDLALVYLGGLDAVEHRFLAPAMPDFFGAYQAPEEYTQVLPNYYRFIDEGLKRLLRLADERTLFIVCSVYGVHPSGDVPATSGSHANSPPGVLIVRGPNLSPQDAPLTVTTADLAPTVLAAVGVTIPTEMDGRMLVGALPSWLLERFPPDYEPTDLPPPEPPPDASNATVLDGLVDARLGMLLGGLSRRAPLEGAW